MDIRQSENYAHYMQSLGWVVEMAGKNNVFIRHFPVISHWSVVKIQHPQRPIDLAAIDIIAKNHHALFAKIEPLQPLNLSPDNWPLLPTKTLIINLPKTTLASLPKGTRYEIRKAGNLKIRQSGDVRSFYKFLQETMKIGHWSVPIKKEVTNLYQSFQPNNSVILLTDFSGCLLIWHENTAHYMYAALTKKGRELRAAYLTLWEAIKFCQSKRLKFLDLEGIYDERYPSHTKHWQGFTKFKEGWNGRVLEYPGSYTKYYNPLAKLLFSIGHW